jgi:hypothetical protein
MPKIHWDIEQGSAAWFKLHNTIPTSSRFSDVMTPKKMDMSASRKKYACQIIAARLLNWQADSLSKIQHIEDGRRQEPIAVAQLELVREVETKSVGFISTTDGKFGASPDRVVMKGDQVQITVEAKCPTIPVQLSYLLEAQLAAMAPVSEAAIEYRCQRQGHLLIAEAEEAIFYSYNERTPACYVRSYRDEPFIKKLDAALHQFDEELEMLMEAAQQLGAFQAFASLLSPAEAEYGSGHYAPPTDADIQDMIDGRGHALA